jgi:hypothetical protein
MTLPSLYEFVCEQIAFVLDIYNRKVGHKGPADRVSAAKIFPLGLLLSGYLSEP